MKLKDIIITGVFVLLLMFSFDMFIEGNYQTGFIGIIIALFFSKWFWILLYKLFLFFLYIIKYLINYMTTSNSPKSNYKINIVSELYKVDNMTGTQFENYVAELLKRIGFSNIGVTQASNDYGVDIIAFVGDTRYAFQCKRYAKSIGNSAIQEIVAGKQYYNCDEAIVITNNYFTKNAINLAEKCDVSLWNRNALIHLIGIAYNETSYISDIEDNETVFLTTKSIVIYISKTDDPLIENVLELMKEKSINTNFISYDDVKKALNIGYSRIECIFRYLLNNDIIDISETSTFLMNINNKEVIIEKEPNNIYEYNINQGICAPVNNEVCFRNMAWDTPLIGIARNEIGSGKANCVEVKNIVKIRYENKYLWDRKCIVQYSCDQDTQEIISGDYIFSPSDNPLDDMSDYIRFKQFLTLVYDAPDRFERIWNNDYYKNDNSKLKLAISLGHVSHISLWSYNNAYVCLGLNYDENGADFSLRFINKNNTKGTD